MTTLAKAGIAITGIGTVGAGTVFGYYGFSKETFEDKLKGTLLTLGSEDNKKWEARVTTLNSDEVVSESLKLVKSKKDSIQKELQKWCNSTLSNTFSSEEDKSFKEVQKYCVYNIKEKIGKVVEISEWNDDTNNKKLKENTDNKPLSTVMADIHKKLNVADSPDAGALKTWCEKAYSMVFKGENDQDFKDGKEYCTADK